MASPSTLWQLQLRAWKDPVQRRRLLAIFVLGLVTLPLCWWLPGTLPSVVVIPFLGEVSGTVLVWGLRSVLLSLVSIFFALAYGRAVIASAWDYSLPFPVALAKGVATVPAIALVYELCQLLLLTLLGSLFQLWSFPLIGFFLWELLLAVQLLSLHLFNPQWGIPAFYTVYASGRANIALKLALLGGAGAVAHECNDAYQQVQNRKLQVQLKEMDIELDKSKVELDKSKVELEKSKVELKKLRILRHQPPRGGWFS